MDDELVAAIAAAPDDDAPRLVYADWLMQRGDPRGELIALQCRVARGDAAPDVVAREAELRAALAPAIVAPLHAIAPGGYELRRGFVEHAELFRGDIPDELVARAPLLRSIGVRGTIVEGEPPACLARLDALALHELGAASSTRPSDVAAFVASPHLGRLRRLAIAKGRLDDAMLGALGAIAAPLEHLHVDASYPDPRVRASGAAFLARLAARSALRTVVVVGFDDRSVAALVAARPDLHVATAVLPYRSRAMFPADFAACMASDRIILAIQLVCAWSGASLAEANTAVERIFGRA